MAFIDGKYQGSSVTRALARHKLGEAQQSTERDGGHNRGDGEEVTVKKMPGGGFHTISKHHDGSTSEADHQSLEQVTEHMGGHFGAQKPLREKNPKMREKEPSTEQSAAPPQEGLSAMGIDAEA